MMNLNIAYLPKEFELIKNTNCVFKNAIWGLFESLCYRFSF